MALEQQLTWDDVERIAGRAAMDAVMGVVESGSSAIVDPLLIATETSASAEEVSLLLERLSELGVLKKVLAFTCPNPQCKHPLAPSDVEMGECSNCGTTFKQIGKPPVETSQYRTSGAISRGVPWLFAVHGFNTVGEWQEEFSWRIANKYRRRAPVLNYKFGLVRISVLFRWRHRQLARQLGRQIKLAQAFATEGGIAEPPDVVLHSFGTLLFTTLLSLEEFKDLTFGRVLLAGSIVRPDFDWGAHQQKGRIGAVLNHCGLRDWPVQIAVFAIPESGPSGHRGFDAPTVLNVRAEKYGHGTFFDRWALTENLVGDGLWDRFLRYPETSLATGIATFVPSSAWWTLPRPAWTALRWAAILGVAALLGWLGSWIWQLCREHT